MRKPILALKSMQMLMPHHALLDDESWAGKLLLNAPPPQCQRRDSKMAQQLHVRIARQCLDENNVAN